MYGLTLRSALSLPELDAVDPSSDSDACVRFGSIRRRPAKDEPQAGCFYATPEEAYFFWEGWGGFLVRDGREIVVEPLRTGEEQWLRLVLLGMGLGTLLHQRGILTLHASVVNIHGHAVAFAGVKGQGKSTLAAALRVRGHGVVADDIAALTQVGQSDFTALPGFPQLKLWPDAVEFLGESPEALPRLHSRLEKRAYRILRGFTRKPLPLRCIYTLTEGTQEEIVPLERQEKFVELMRHAYALRFLGTNGVTAAHFHRTMQLARAVPVFRLIRPQKLSALSDLARLVETHAASLNPVPCSDSPAKVCVTNAAVV